jgi:hypothetical protein
MWRQGIVPVFYLLACDGPVHAIKKRRTFSGQRRGMTSKKKKKESKRQPSDTRCAQKYLSRGRRPDRPCVATDAGHGVVDFFLNRSLFAFHTSFYWTVMSWARAFFCKTRRQGPAIRESRKARHLPLLFVRPDSLPSEETLAIRRQRELVYPPLGPFVPFGCGFDYLVGVITFFAVF